MAEAAIIDVVTGDVGVGAGGPSQVGVDAGRSGQWQPGGHQNWQEPVQASALHPGP